MEGVRPAAPGDRARCAQLVAQALAEAGRLRGGDALVAGTAEPDELVARWLAEAETRLLVGTFADATVGLAAGRLTGAGPDRVGHIDCLYVEPAARGGGVGAGLVDELVGWFENQSCRAVDCRALPGDRSTKRLLEASGFSARLLVLRRPLR